MSKYEIRPAELSEFEELVKMYMDLIKVLYKGFNIKDSAYFYRIVIGWFETQKDIVVCVDKSNGEIAGFTLGYIDDIGIVDPYYNGDIAYVKPEYRKTRVAFLLYQNVVKYAEKLKMRCIAKAFVGDGNIEKIDKIQSRFGKPRYIEFITGEVQNG